MKTTIALILDEQFGTKLYQLPHDELVWICNSQHNQVVVDEIRKQFPDRSITSFQYDASDAAEKICEGVLSDIALHHSEWQMIEVYGLKYHHKMKQGVILALESAFAKKLTKVFFHKTTRGFRISKKWYPEVPGNFLEYMLLVIVATFLAFLFVPTCERKLNEKTILIAVF
jgi:hypothetical protein